MLCEAVAELRFERLHLIASMKCCVCDNETGNRVFAVREMLTGSRETFDYLSCGACGSLRILNIPPDLERHYRGGYFAFKDLQRLARNRWRRVVDSQRVTYGLDHRGLVGRLLSYVCKPLDYVGWAAKLGLGRDARILDVGCGNGKLLLRMKLGGFKHCLGVDPFIRETLEYPNGVVIHKCRLSDVSWGPFDLVMFHHSFEHIADPYQVLKAAAAVLSDNGWILIRVPVADSYAREHYRENWVGMQAPTHLYIPTTRSMKLSLEKIGLKVYDTESVATIGQFTASELYLRGIPACASKRDRAIFLPEQLHEFQRKTDELNRKGMGDQRIFYIKRKPLDAGSVPGATGKRVFPVPLESSAEA